MGLVNLFGSMAVTLLTFVAEIGGVALALELATSVQEFLWVPLTAAAVWIVLWRGKFSLLENVFGLLGLALVVFAVAAVAARPDWAALLDGDASPRSRAPRSGRRTVLRGRAVRRGDDAVRGLLLLLRGGRGALDAARNPHDAGQRVHRLPARGPAVAGDRRRRHGDAAARRHRGGDARPGGAAGRHRAGQARTRRSPSSASSPPPSAPPARPGCRWATASASTSAGSGASTSAASRRRASTS